MCRVDGSEKRRSHEEREESLDGDDDDDDDSGNVSKGRDVGCVCSFPVFPCVEKGVLGGKGKKKSALVGSPNSIQVVGCV